jgi:uncharacterized protein YbjT (DUF2867 family)
MARSAGIAGFSGLCEEGYSTSLAVGSRTSPDREWRVTWGHAGYRRMVTIAVTTPTGHVGSRAVQLLTQAGVRPTVLARDPAKVDRDRVDVEQGNLLDAAYVAEATKGIDALLWIVPDSFSAADPLADIVRMGENAAAAIRANGIARTVMISSVGAERKHGAGLIDGLARNEEALAATGTNVLILRCGYFFTNLLGSLDAIKAGVLSTALEPDVATPWVDPRDVGEVAAARLLAADWTGVEIQGMHGPADLSWTRVAEIVTAATGRAVKVRTETDDETRAALSAAGMTPAAVEGVVAMTAALRGGFTPEQARSPLTTTPTTLDGWIYAHLRPLL